MKSEMRTGRPQEERRPDQVIRTNRRDPPLPIFPVKVPSARPDLIFGNFYSRCDQHKPQHAAAAGSVTLSELRYSYAAHSSPISTSWRRDVDLHKKSMRPVCCVLPNDKWHLGKIIAVLECNGTCLAPAR